MKKFTAQIFAPLLTLLTLSTFTAPQALAQSSLAGINLIDLAGLSPYTSYKTFETQHFTMIYEEGYFDFTERAAVHLEHAHEVLQPILKWTPRGKTTILVTGNSDEENGLTMPALRVGIVLIATPPDAWSELSYTDDWIKLLVFHEYTHMLNVDATTEWMEALRWVFGDVIRPNSLWPRWMLEGLAVYYETRTSQTGRGRSPYYDSIVRAYLNEGKLSTQDEKAMRLDRVNGNYPYFPGGAIAYLFGYHLWNQFSKIATESQMGDYSMNSSQRIPFFIEGNLENVTHQHWVDLWNSFVKESSTRLGGQITQIKNEGITPSTQITHAGYSAVGGALSPDGQWIAYTQTTTERRQGLYLRNLKDGKESWVDDKSSGVGMSFTPDSRYLVYSGVELSNSYNSFSDLFVYDLKRNRNRQITHGLRIKEPALSPDGTHVAFIQNEHATMTLKSARISWNEDGDTSFNTIRNAYSASKFAILGNPQYLDREKIVFSLQETGNAFSDLVQVDFDGQNFKTLFHDGKMNRFPLRAGTTTEAIYFVSDKNGIENLYSLDPFTHDTKRVTNVITGLTLPFSRPDASTLFASVMTSDGYEIVQFDKSALGTNLSSKKIAEPSAPEALASALQSPDLGIKESNSKPYSAWGSLLPREWAPLAYANSRTNSGTTLGGLILGFDSTGKNEYSMLGQYNLKPKTFDGTFNYTYYGFRPLINLSASSSTTDIASDAAQSQYNRHYETLLGLDYPIFWTHSRLRTGVYGFVDWNKTYDIYSKQEIASSNFEYANRNVPGVGAYVNFSDTEGSILSFMPERGSSLTLEGEDRVNLDHYSLIKYLAEVKHYFKVASHSVLVPRGVFLGSSHTSGYDNGYAILQGKRTTDLSDTGVHSSLSNIGIRGYSNLLQPTRRAAIGSMDFHFPLIKALSGLGDTAPGFLSQLHGFVFGESGFIPKYIYHDNLFLPSYGGGVTLDTSILLYVPVSFTLQVQSGTNKDFGGDTQEFFNMTLGSFY